MITELLIRRRQGVRIGERDAAVLLAVKTEAKGEAFLREAPVSVWALKVGNKKPGQ